MDGERERFLVRRYQRRVAHVLNSLRVGRTIRAGRRTFNESVGDLKTALRPRARRAERARLDSEIEFLFAWELRERGIAEPEPSDIKAIAEEFAKTLKPRRGRPDDRLLSYHVEGLALLFEETCGRPLLQCQTLNSDYRPNLRGDIGQVFLKLIQSVDPGVTETSITNIIRLMPARESAERKRFRDYFPLADGAGEVLNASGNFEVKEVGLIWPIYCS